MTKVDGELGPRRARRHRAVRRRRRDPGPARPPAARAVHGAGHAGLRRPDGQLFFTNPSIIPNGSINVGRPDIFGMRFTTDRAFMVLIAVVFALCLIGVGGAAPRPVRPPPGGHERQPGRLRHRGHEHHQDEARRLRPRRRPGRAGGRPLRRHVPDGLLLPVQLREQPGALRRGGPGRHHHPQWRGAGRHRGGLLPLIATHIPSVSGFTYILFGVGIIAVGRNPYGLGLALHVPRRMVGRPPRPDPGGWRCDGRTRRPGPRGLVSRPRCPPLADPDRSAARPGAAGRGRLGALRWPAGARCRRARGGAGRGPRPDRAERRRQDDAVQRHHRPAAPHPGTCPSRCARRDQVQAPHAGPPRPGPDLPAPRAVRHPVRPRERADGGRGAAAQARRAGGPRPRRRTTSWRGSGSSTWPTSRPTRCPPGWPASSRWRGPSPPHPRSCSSTSRARGSTRRRPRPGCRAPAAGVRGDGRPPGRARHGAGDGDLRPGRRARQRAGDRPGDPAAVQADPVVQEAYLGGEPAVDPTPAEARPVRRARATTAPSSGRRGRDRTERATGRRRRSPPSTCGPGTGASRCCTGSPSRSGGFGHGAARPERRRQDDAAQGDLGTARPDGRDGRGGGSPRWGGTPRSNWPGPACA